MKAFHECVETLRRDGGMSKDTSELIKKNSINLCCQPIFSYISSLIIVPNAPFSQSLSHIFKISMSLILVSFASLAELNILTTSTFQLLVSLQSASRNVATPSGHSITGCLKKHFPAIRMVKGLPTSNHYLPSLGCSTSVVPVTLVVVGFVGGDGGIVRLPPGQLDELQQQP